MKRKKLQEMESSFERERRSKRLENSHRASKSELNRTQSLMRKKEQTQQSLSSLDRVRKSNARQARQGIRDMLEKRKMYETGLGDSRVSRASNSSSRSATLSQR
jgi:hypothetical protein